MNETGRRQELTRIRRVADQLCTSHAWLAGDFARKATIVDVLVLLSSAWIVSLAFVDPVLAAAITPGSLRPTLWIGLMGVCAFGLTLLQTRLDLRGRADTHRRALDAYTEVKRSASRLLSEEGQPEQEAFNDVLARQDFASSLGIAVPEHLFLALKQRHLTKIAISRHLDAHPGANLLIVKFQLLARDTFAKTSPRGGRAEQRDTTAITSAGASTSPNPLAYPTNGDDDPERRA